MATAILSSPPSNKYCACPNPQDPLTSPLLVPPLGILSDTLSGILPGTPPVILLGILPSPLIGTLPGQLLDSQSGYLPNSLSGSNFS